ncbi:hypothetical protein GCM10017688_62770 [Streptomyces ramulosus]
MVSEFSSLSTGMPTLFVVCGTFCAGLDMEERLRFGGEEGAEWGVSQSLLSTQAVNAADGMSATLARRPRTRRTRTDEGPARLPGRGLRFAGRTTRPAG